MTEETIPLWKKVLDWFKKLPWWGKVLGCVALVGVALLFVAQFFKPAPGAAASPLADAAQEHNVDDATTRYATEKTRLEKDLKTKKMIEITLINQTGTMSKKAVELREKINNAKSIEEIDSLLKTVK